MVNTTSMSADCKIMPCGANLAPASTYRYCLVYAQRIPPGSAQHYVKRLSRQLGYQPNTTTASIKSISQLSGSAPRALLAALQESFRSRNKRARNCEHLLVCCLTLCDLRDRRYYLQSKRGLATQPTARCVVKYPQRINRPIHRQVTSYYTQF